MSSRVIALLLVVMSGVLQVGLVIPTHRQVIAHGEEYRRLREAVREARRELAEQEGRAAARSRVSGILAVRQAVSGRNALRGPAFRAAGLGGGPSASQRASRGQPAVTARRRNLPAGCLGPVSGRRRLAGDLARPESGLVLETLSFRSDRDGVSLDVQGQRLGRCLERPGGGRDARRDRGLAGLGGRWSPGPPPSPER